MHYALVFSTSKAKTSDQTASAWLTDFTAACAFLNPESDASWLAPGAAAEIICAPTNPQNYPDMMHSPAFQALRNLADEAFTKLCGTINAVPSHSAAATQQGKPNMPITTPSFITNDVPFQIAVARALRAMPWQGLWFHGRLRVCGGAFATGYFWCGPWNGEPYTLWFTWRSDNGSLAWFRVRGSAVLESESSTSSEASTESRETVD